jgi:hypothetical protein
MIEIKKSEHNFTKLRYLCRALYKPNRSNYNDEERHEIYTVIHIDADSTGYATDGCRMHIVKATGIEQGDYTVSQNTKSTIQLECAKSASTVKYGKVIPDESELSEPKAVALYFDREWSLVASVARMCGYAFQMCYLLDMLLETEKIWGETVVVRYSLKRHLIVVEQGDYKALVVGYTDNMNVAVTEVRDDTVPTA